MVAVLPLPVVLLGISFLLFGFLVGGHVAGGILGPPVLWERTRRSPPSADLVGIYIETERHWNRPKVEPNSIELRQDGSVEHLLTSLEHIGDTGSVRKRGGIFAVRNLLDVSPEVRELAHSEAVRASVEPVLGERFFPVRGILFDKILDANWKVPWRQDVTIVVQERVEAKGFGP